MTSTDKKSETSIATRRKEQVLAAAVACFRRDGFHRSSMSRISAEAGMSSGHIYHYYASKEKIVEAIVASERSLFDLLVNDLKAAMLSLDPISALTDVILKNAERYMDGGHAALMLEILAEAARNVEVAGLIRGDDEEVREIFYGLFGGWTPEIASRGELLGALLDGLLVRAVRNPDLGSNIDRNMLRHVIRQILLG